MNSVDSEGLELCVSEGGCLGLVLLGGTAVSALYRLDTSFIHLFEFSFGIIYRRTFFYKLKQIFCIFIYACKK